MLRFLVWLAGGLLITATVLAPATAAAAAGGEAAVADLWPVPGQQSGSSTTGASSIDMTGNWIFTLSESNVGLLVPVTLVETNGVLTGSGMLTRRSCPFTISGTQALTAVAMTWALSGRCGTNTIALTGVTTSTAASGAFVATSVLLPGGTWTAVRTV